MELNYIKEDEKVNEKIILYRKSSKIIEEDDRCKQLQVQENKNPENVYMFQDYEYNNREWQKEHILFDKKEYIFCSFKTRNLVEMLYLMRVKCTVRIHRFGMLHLKIYTSMLAIFGIVHSKIADLVNIKLFLTIVV